MSLAAAAYDPHGAAVLDYFRGDASATLICYQDGKRDDVPAAFWFRDRIDPIEEAGLDMCRGKTLDVGAGTGVHALLLQQRGVDVTAIDVSAACVEIMRARGVRNAIAADLYAFDGGTFDTIYCLCNGLDKVGRVDQLPGFLKRMRALLAPGGRLIADSFDLRVGASEDAKREMRRKTECGRYFGEMDLVFEYGGQRGPAFTTLQVDSETLARIALEQEWSCEIVARRGGHYLACLHSRSNGRPPKH